MSFNVSDNVNDDDIIVDNISQNTGNVTEDSFREFFQAGEEKPVEFKIQSKDEKHRVAELTNFVTSRIVAAVRRGWKTDYIIDHTAKMLVDLVHFLKLPKLNNPRTNATGLWRKAKQKYIRDEILKNVSELNQEIIGKPLSGAILNPEKPRFGTALFNSLAENVESNSPNLEFLYKSGGRGKEESYRYDDALNLRAIQQLKSEVAKIKRAAKAAGRDLTDQESQECEMLNQEISAVWNKFFENAKTVIGSAQKMFPETVSTSRTTTSAVLKSAASYDSINLGVFEL